MPRLLLLATLILASCTPERRGEPREPSDACTPKSCEELGAGCGTVDDACGNALSCGSCEAPATCGGGGVEHQCGSPGCTPRDDCRSSGFTCGTIPDGCGGTVSCGECSSDETCGGGGTPGRCGRACTGESDAELCRDGGFACGSHTFTDRCGSQRQVDSCGRCSTWCTDAGRCYCAAETDEELCAAGGIECGSASATDRCGARRELACGACSGVDSCGGGGTPNRCGCTPLGDAELCARFQRTCGTISTSDGCGHDVTPDCGACRSSETCTDKGLCTPWGRADPGTVNGAINRFEAIGGTGPDDVFFAGYADNGTLLAHWDGTRLSWGSTTSMRGAEGLFGTPGGPVWMVGVSNGGSGVIRRSAGGGSWQTWTTAAISPSAPSGLLLAIHGSSASDIWAVGRNGVGVHYDGATWTRSTITTSGAELRGVYAVAAEDVWAVGSDGVAYQYRGAGWTGTAVAVHGLHGVHGTASDDVWAVGGSTVLHYDGTRWRVVSGAIAGRSYTGVWADGRGVAWVASYNGSILRCTTQSCDPIGLSSAFNAVWGTSHTSGWMAGDNAVIFRFVP